jgi:hypothetical protein
MVLQMNGRGGLTGFFGGLVSAEVHRVRVDFADGSSLSIVPAHQPVGEAQPFLGSAVGPAPTSITAVSESGEALMTIDLTPPVASAPMTEPAATALPTDD